MTPRLLLLALTATQALAGPPAMDVPRNRIHDYTFWGIRSSAVSRED